MAVKGKMCEVVSWGLKPGQVGTEESREWCWLMKIRVVGKVEHSRTSVRNKSDTAL